ncbi:MAG: ferritin family protein [Gammaproteobacteria bacterium]|nr:ferritin family protein [Gammaproteobacteria bacterium]
MDTLEELLAHAIAIEAEATARYTELAEQMQTHNNPAVASFFKRMARIEALHLDKLRAHPRAPALPAIAPGDYAWQDPESPEAVDYGAVHYLLTPREALELARLNEQRACAFFENAALRAGDEAMRALAMEFADDEREHIRLVALEIERCSAATAASDMDPPNIQD